VRTTAGLDIRILGPVEVIGADGGPIHLGGAKQRTVFVMLLLASGLVVSTDRLIDGVWGDDPPRTAPATLRTYISHLRRILGDNVVIERRGPGFRMVVAPDLVDAERSRRLASEGRRLAAEKSGRALEALRAALAEFRGPILGDLGDLEFAQVDRERLEEVRWRLQEDIFAVELDLLHHEETLSDMRAAVRQAPYREGLRAQLMLALYRAGRQTDALAAYQDLRRLLADELGIEPGAELQDLEERILQHDPRLRLPAASPILDRAFDPAVVAIDPESASLGQVTALVESRGGWMEYVNGPTFSARFPEPASAWAAAVEMAGYGCAAAAMAGELEPSALRRLSHAAEPGKPLCTGVLARAAGVAGQTADVQLPGLAHRISIVGVVKGPLLHSLPVESTSFVGRESELEELARVLASGVRQITLVGSGGVGKTRLAQQAAADLVGRVRDGVWWLSLAGETEESMPTALATATGAEIGSGTDPIDATMAHIAASQMLLVFDNCEHIRASAARLVAQIVELCSDVQVLATSREPLHTSGEMLWHVDPLDLPATDAGPLEARQSSAVRLFYERGQVAEAEADLIATICRDLDGLPLAIELAAAQTRLLSLPQIGDLLTDRLRLLRRRGPTLETPRHRTLEAAIEWTYRLLSREEQEALLRFSTFEGAVGLETAALVLADDADPYGSLELLAALVDRSALEVVTTASGDRRYRMLESIKAFGRAQIEPRARRDCKRRRLSRYIGIAAGLEAEAGSMEARLRDLDAEISDVSAAIEDALGSEDPVSAARLVCPLERYWHTRGRYSSARRWLDVILSDPGKLDARSEALTRASAGFFATARGDTERAVAELERARVLWATLTDGDRVADTDSKLGWAYMRRGQYEQASGALTAAIEHYRASGGEAGELSARWDLGVIAAVNQDWDTARGLFRDALVLARRTGERGRQAQLLNNLGLLDLLTGPMSEAVSTLEEALELADLVGEDHVYAQCLANLGWAAAMVGEDVEAASRYDEGLARLCRTDRWFDALFVVELVAELAWAVGDPQEAARLLASADEYRRRSESPRPPYRMSALEALSRHLTAALEHGRHRAIQAAGATITIEEAAERARRFCQTVVSSPPG
jgi:predicted ATPase/DNA-binding SARP family transcriptional activator/Tfp pilus assembly protein PilF